MERSVDVVLSGLVTAHFLPGIARLASSHTAAICAAP